MEAKNPLPRAVLDALKVTPPPPPPPPEIFTKQDFAWLEVQLKHVLVSLYKVTPDPKQADALVAAMMHISLGVAMRSLKPDSLSSKFYDQHSHVCGLWGGLSADRTKADAVRYRVQSLEYRTQRHADHLKSLKERFKNLEKADKQ